MELTKVMKIKNKVKIQEVYGQEDCFNDCKTTTWSGNRNSTDNGGKCEKKVTPNCHWTCDW